MKGLFSVLFLLGLLTPFDVFAGETATRCPPGDYPYRNRPCNEGQAYVEVNRSHRAWLRARSDFSPLRVELVPGYTAVYEWKCYSSFFPWIPETGCGIAYFRPGSECSAMPNKQIHELTAGQQTCEEGCEFRASGSSESSPTGAVCMPDPCPNYPDSGCGKSVAELRVTAKSPVDPRSLFHAQQTCIARKSCELRCQMDNCQWMDYVIPGFVEPYLRSEGSWLAIEGSCGAVQVLLAGVPGGKWIADRECFSTMGWYHVQIDLKNALDKYGCGSKSDWDVVGKQIVPCLAETQPGYPRSYYTMGGIFVHMARDSVRAQCLAKRASQGLPVEIGADMGGKVCKVAD